MMKSMVTYHPFLLEPSTLLKCPQAYYFLCLSKLIMEKFLDFLADLPQSESTTTIVVIVDELVKMTHFIPCIGLPNTKNAHNYLYKLHFIYIVYLIPWFLMGFTAKFWKEVTRVWGMQI